jgi:hypothetical protein
MISRLSTSGYDRALCARQKGETMTRIGLTCAAVAAAVLLQHAPVQAQGLHTYVASYGSGTACSRTAPCAYFQDAYNATTSGGEITCLDSGEFAGGLIIAKAITIDCGSNVGSLYYALRVNAPGAVVVLRGLTLLANGVEPYGLNITDGIVHIENSRFLNYAAASMFSGIAGINFAPTTFGSHLFVVDSLISHNGGASSGGGILIQPGFRALATFTIDRTRIESNRVGIYAVAGSGNVHGVVRDSVVAGSATWGIGAVGANTKLLVENTTVSANSYGLVAEGGGTMLVSHSSIVQNGTGLYKAGGGTLVSSKNNNLHHNTTDGTFSSTLVQQ